MPWSKLMCLYISTSILTVFITCFILCFQLIYAAGENPVAIDEFDFGGYVLLVRTSPYYNVHALEYDAWYEITDEQTAQTEPGAFEFDRQWYIPARNPHRDIYALVGEGINSFAQGVEFYEELNSLFYKEILPDDPSFIYEREDYSEVIKAFFSRNVVFISIDGRRVLALSPLEMLSEVRYSNVHPRFYEIFEGDKVTHSFSAEEIWMDVLIPCITLSSYAYFNYGRAEDYIYVNWEENLNLHLPAVAVDYGNPNRRLLSISPDGDIIGFLNGSWVYLYSLPDLKFIDIIYLKSTVSSRHVYLQILNSGYWIYGMEGHGAENIQFYILDTNSMKEEYLGEIPRSGLYRGTVFLPCARYAAYTLSGHNEDTPNGLFIHDFETGQIVFYEIETTHVQIVSWSHRDGVDQLINGR